jgi:thioredoxin 1
MDLFKKLMGSDKEETQTAPSAAKAPAAEPTHLTAEEFDRQISESTVPVVVDFWAEWCGPCHAIAPSVTKLAQEYDGRAFIGKVDADEYPEILSRYGIMGIPTLIFFTGGQEADRVVGLTQYNTLKSKLERLLA